MKSSFVDVQCGTYREMPIMNYMETRKISGAGFTIIELLVVIAIIGILSTVVLASLGGARAKGRDARRVSDLKQMANLVAQLPEGTLFLGCTTSGPASGCTTPNFASYPGIADPSSPTGICGIGALAAPCNYRVAKRSASGQPSATDWQICAYLEAGAGSLSSGAVYISNDTNYSIVSGGCTY